MPLGSIIGGVIGQQGAQGGGDMAWGGALQGFQQAQQANQQNNAEAVRARNALTPWTGAGTSALGKITQLLGLGTLTQEGNDQGIYWVKADSGESQKAALNAFQTTPGYQFRMDEGIKARDRGASARGMTLSGAQSKAIDTYGQNVASEEFNNYLNQLSALSGGGATAQGAANNTSAGLIGGGSNALVQGGNMLAQGAAARGSAYSQGANALASGIGSASQNAMFLGTLGMGGGSSGSSYANDKWNSGLARGRAAGWL